MIFVTVTVLVDLVLRKVLVVRNILVNDRGRNRISGSTNIHEYIHMKQECDMQRVALIV